LDAVCLLFTCALHDTLNTALLHQISDKIELIA